MVMAVHQKKIRVKEVHGEKKVDVDVDCNDCPVCYLFIKFDCFIM